MSFDAFMKECHEIGVLKKENELLRQLNSLLDGQIASLNKRLDTMTEIAEKAIGTGIKSIAALTDSYKSHRDMP